MIERDLGYIPKNLLENLLNLPVPPKTGKLFLTVNGSDFSPYLMGGNAANMHDKYLDQCKEKNIIPYSSLIFNNEIGYDFQADSSSVKFEKGFYKDGKDVAKRLLTGGRIHRVLFNLDETKLSFINGSYLKDFRKSLRILRAMDYKVQSGNLVFSKKLLKKTFFAKKEYQTDSELTITDRLDLSIGSTLDNVSTIKLVDWFEKIK